MLSIGILSSMGCSGSKQWDKTLPNSQDLFSKRGLQVARSVTHIHSPISYDACSNVDATTCLTQLRHGLCSNRINFAAVTDHPNSMAASDFEALVLYKPGDQLIQGANGPIGNIIQCTNGNTLTVTAGYENQLMPIGMTQHLDSNIESRQNLYTQRSPELVARLQKETGAIVIMPHTETNTKTVALLQSLNLDGIEIYNIHANVNPQIRNRDLGFDYFDGLVDLLVFWIDPYGKQQPDLAFMSFMKVSPVYAQKWDALIAAGQHPVGLSGNDGHQSLFPGTARDGEKIDSFRRTIRWATNHFLVKDQTLPEIKNAILAARGWTAFEGLGTPVGFDFHLTTSTGTQEIGDTTPMAALGKTIQVVMPQLHPASPADGPIPTLTMNLIRVDPTTGTESIVATSNGPDINFPVTQAGAYRVEVTMIPLHLQSYLGYKKTMANQEFKWIISNHLYVSP